jgi:very-short-patch-repair endonuclease
MTFYIPYRKDLQEYSRKMRREMTEAERCFWNRVRRRAFQGLLFVRQKPLLSYIADFYCAELQLVIEIDGESHDDKEEYDKIRTCDLGSKGINVIRYTNDQMLFHATEVFSDLSIQIERIRNNRKSSQYSFPP